MIVLDDAEATLALGRSLARMLQSGDVIGLIGPLGAGKTVLTRGILAGLGHAGEVPSPSFPLVIPYDPPTTCLALTHVDLYRIDDPEDLVELGLDEARALGVVVIEWPERLAAWGREDMLVLSLDVLSDGTRRLTAQVPPAWEARWPPR